MNLSRSTGIVNRDLDLLAPFFKDKAVDAINAANQAGYPIFIFEGFRTPQRQQALLDASHKVVTTKGAWRSWHQYGLAFDIAYGGPGKWNWNGDFEKPAHIITQHGLEWIPDFELGHFQLSGGLRVEDAYQITRDYGVQMLWTVVKENLTA